MVEIIINIWRRSMDKIKEVLMSLFVYFSPAILAGIAYWIRELFT